MVPLALESWGTIAAVWSTAVLGSSVKGLVLVFAAWVAVRAMARATAASRHLVWTVALAGMVALPLLAPLVPSWNVGPRVPALFGWQSPEVADVATGTPAAMAPTGVEGVPGASAPPHGSTAASSDGSGAFEIPASSRVTGAAPTASARVGPVTLAVERTAKAPSAARSVWAADARSAPRPASRAAATGPAVWPARPSLGALVVSLWVAGGLLAFLPLIAGRIRLRGMLKRARLLRDPGARRVVAEAHVRLGLRRRVAVYTTPELRMPVTWGTLRPVVLLPAAAAEWSRERLAHVALHELAHVGRWDDAGGMLARLACALHWFNPAVWVAAAGLRRERERACDDRVLEAGCRPSAYAQDLLDVARGTVTPRLVGAASVPMARRSDLEPRLMAILDPTRGRRGPGALTVMLTFALLGVVVVPLAALAPRAVTPTVAAPETRDTPPRLARIPSPQEPSWLCRGGRSSSRSTRSSDDPADWSLEARWSDDDCRTEVLIEGEVRFSPSEDAIEWMGPRSSFELEIDVDGNERSLEAEPGPDGDPVFDYRVDGDRRPFDGEARTWLAAVLPQVFRETGILAEERVQRILGEGGVEAVFDEVALLRSDYVTRIYLSYLVEHGDLTTSQFDRVVALAGEKVDSDYELAELLVHVARTEGLTELIRDSYLAATATLDSDYEHRRVLDTFLDQGPLSTTDLAEVLALAENIESDYERAELLIRVGRENDLRGAAATTYLRVTAALDSDYEMRRTLSSLLGRVELDRSDVEMVLEMAREIDSDYERAELLIETAASTEIDGDLREEYIAVAEEIGSEYERDRALAALVRYAHVR